MQIRQLQVARDAVQDRLTLRIATQANEEIRVWFTRRFLRELWPYMTAMLSGHLVARPQAAVAGAEPAAPSFEQPFRDDNPLYPLGANPLLASEATLQAAGDGVATLTLREGRERSVNLSLTAELLHALCAMLRASADQSGWDLALDYVAASPDALPAGGSKPSILH